MCTLELLSEEISWYAKKLHGCVAGLSCLGSIPCLHKAAEVAGGDDASDGCGREARQCLKQSLWLGAVMGHLLFWGYSPTTAASKCKAQCEACSCPRGFVDSFSLPGQFWPVMLAALARVRDGASPGCQVGSKGGELNPTSSRVLGTQESGQMGRQTLVWLHAAPA